MSAAPGPPAARAVTALLVLTAVGTGAFWIGFFAAGDALHSADTDVYLAFEAAFPAADAWMASAALAAAIGLARRRAWAIPAGIAAGSALVFLGLMDVLYDLEHARALRAALGGDGRRDGDQRLLPGGGAVPDGLLLAPPRPPGRYRAGVGDGQGAGWRPLSTRTGGKSNSSSGGRRPTFALTCR